MKAPDKSLEHSGCVVVPPISKDPVMFGPNITGKVKNVGLNFSETESVGSTWGTKEDWWGGSNDDNYKTTLNFDASRSSSVYGESSIVQPSSVRLLPCIKL